MAVFNLGAGSRFGTQSVLGGAFLIGGGSAGLESGVTPSVGGIAVEVDCLVSFFLGRVDLAASRAFRSSDRNCANLSYTIQWNA